MRRVTEDGGDLAGIAIPVNEGGSLDAIVALPADCQGGVVFFDVDRLGIAVAGERCGELIGRVDEPRIAGFGGEQDKLTDGDDAAVAVGCAPYPWIARSTAW